MAINSYFFNAVQSGDTYDRVYTAEDFTSYLDKIVGTGVFANPSTNLQVQASSGMNVIVKAGQAWVNGHKLDVTADHELEVEQSDVVINRIDRVVAYLDMAERAMGLTILKGTSSGAQALTRTETRYELCLAEITVTRQATSISPVNITDTRGNDSLCGYVAGLIHELDTETLFQQWQAQFDEWYNGIINRTWDANFIQKAEVVATCTSSNPSVAVGAQVEVEDGVDVVEVYTNGIRLRESEYTHSGAGSSYTITLVNPPTGSVEVAVVVYSPRQL